MHAITHSRTRARIQMHVTHTRTQLAYGTRRVWLELLGGVCDNFCRSSQKHRCSTERVTAVAIDKARWRCAKHQLGVSSTET